MDSGELEFVWNLYSLTDSLSYHLPEELFFGSLKSTTEFAMMNQLGDGSSSIVYAAKDKENRTFAMKCLRSNQIRPGAALPKEIFREITILKSLDHENICKFHEVLIGSSPDSLCLLLEYCPYSLAQLIDGYRDEIPHNEIKGITVQLLKGLNYLHKNYIIHRDISPRNLMISNSLTLKIIDFGLSRRFSYPHKASSPNVMTRWYKAPEILLETTGYGCEVDMWSAACVIVELFARRPLLQGESDIAQICLIIDLIGTPTPNIWPGFSKCRQTKNIRLKHQPFNRLADCLSSMNAGPAFELLSGLFVYNPEKRRTAEECLADGWLQRAPFPSKTIEIPADSELEAPKLMVTSS